MTTTRSMPFMSVALALLFSLPTLARADIYALNHDAADNAMTISETVTGNVTKERVPSCCVIANGTPTFDTVGNRAFFIATAGASAEVVTFNYVSGISARAPLSSGYRVTHMEYDASGNRLLALARDALSDQLLMATIVPSTGTVTVRQVLSAPCCTLRTGVSALTTSSGLRMLVVGTNATAQEQVLEFNFTSNTGPIASNIPAGLQVAELAVHPVSGIVFGLGYSSATQLSHPIQLGAAPGYVISTIGPGTANCCFALAGAAAIDRINNQLVIVGLGSAVNTSAVHRFSLSTGVYQTGVGLTANALFEDTGLVTDYIFANGFD